VDEQYLSNTDDATSKLENYSQTDLSINYELKGVKVFKSILFSGLVNNIFDQSIVSNGADYGGGYIYYFPQAGINFLVGITLQF
jgi:iron complex outermembrane receptor protein